jgi:hypothetical protein
MFACSGSKLIPALANSWLHQARMKRPRSSERGSGWITRAPATGHSKNNIIQ